MRFSPSVEIRERGLEWILAIQAHLPGCPQKREIIMAVGELLSKCREAFERHSFDAPTPAEETAENILAPIAKPKTVRPRCVRDWSSARSEVRNMIVAHPVGSSFTIADALHKCGIYSSDGADSAYQTVRREVDKYVVLGVLSAFRSVRGRGGIKTFTKIKEIAHDCTTARKRELVGAGGPERVAHSQGLAGDLRH